MIKFQLKTWICLFAAAILAVGMGCSSGPQASDDEPVRERPRRGASNMDIPSPDELGDNPCGNPNWAQLPEDVGFVEADDEQDDEIDTDDDGRIE